MADQAMNHNLAQQQWIQAARNSASANMQTQQAQNFPSSSSASNGGNTGMNQQQVNAFAQHQMQNQFNNLAGGGGGGGGGGMNAGGNGQGINMNALGMAMGQGGQGSAVGLGLGMAGGQGGFGQQGVGGQGGLNQNQLAQFNQQRMVAQLIAAHPQQTQPQSTQPQSQSSQPQQIQSQPPPLDQMLLRTPQNAQQQTLQASPNAPQHQRTHSQQQLLLMQQFQRNQVMQQNAAMVAQGQGGNQGQQQQGQMQAQGNANANGQQNQQQQQQAMNLQQQQQQAILQQQQQQQQLMMQQQGGQGMNMGNMGMQGQGNMGQQQGGQQAGQGQGQVQGQQGRQMQGQGQGMNMGSAQDQLLQLQTMAVRYRNGELNLNNQQVIQLRAMLQAQQLQQMDQQQQLLAAVNPSPVPQSAQPQNFNPQQQQQQQPQQNTPTMANNNRLAPHMATSLQGLNPALHQQAKALMGGPQQQGQGQGQQGSPSLQAGTVMPNQHQGNRMGANPQQMQQQQQQGAGNLGPDGFAMIEKQEFGNQVNGPAAQLKLLQEQHRQTQNAFPALVTPQMQNSQALPQSSPQQQNQLSQVQQAYQQAQAVQQAAMVSAQQQQRGPQGQQGQQNNGQGNQTQQQPQKPRPVPPDLNVSVNNIQVQQPQPQMFRQDVAALARTQPQTAGQVQSKANAQEFQISSIPTMSDDSLRNAVANIIPNCVREEQQANEQIRHMSQDTAEYQMLAKKRSDANALWTRLAKECLNRNLGIDIPNLLPEPLASAYRMSQGQQAQALQQNQIQTQAQAMIQQPIPNQQQQQTNQQTAEWAAAMQQQQAQMQLQQQQMQGAQQARPVSANAQQPDGSVTSSLPIPNAQVFWKQMEGLFGSRKQQIPVPQIDERGFDLYQLFVSVMQKGGVREVTAQGKWPIVCYNMQLLTTDGTQTRPVEELASALQQFYFSALGEYENRWRTMQNTRGQQPGQPGGQPQQQNSGDNSSQDGQAASGNQGQPQQAQQTPGGGRVQYGNIPLERRDFLKYLAVQQSMKNINGMNLLPEEVQFIKDVRIRSQQAGLINQAQMQGQGQLPQGGAPQQQQNLANQGQMPPGGQINPQQAMMLQQASMAAANQGQGPRVATNKEITMAQQALVAVYKNMGGNKLGMHRTSLAETDRPIYEQVIFEAQRAVKIAERRMICLLCATAQNLVDQSLFQACSISTVLKEAERIWRASQTATLPAPQIRAAIDKLNSMVSTWPITVILPSNTEQGTPGQMQPPGLPGQQATTQQQQQMAQYAQRMAQQGQQPQQQQNPQARPMVKQGSTPQFGDGSQPQGVSPTPDPSGVTGPAMAPRLRVEDLKQPPAKRARASTQTQSGQGQSPSGMQAGRVSATQTPSASTPPSAPTPTASKPSPSSSSQKKPLRKPSVSAAAAAARRKASISASPAEAVPKTPKDHPTPSGGRSSAVVADSPAEIEIIPNPNLPAPAPMGLGMGINGGPSQMQDQPMGTITDFMGVKLGEQAMMARMSEEQMGRMDPVAYLGDSWSRMQAASGGGEAGVRELEDDIRRSLGGALEGMPFGTGELDWFNQGGAMDHSVGRSFGSGGGGGGGWTTGLTPAMVGMEVSPSQASFLHNRGGSSSSMSRAGGGSSSVQMDWSNLIPEEETFDYSLFIDDSAMGGYAESDSDDQQPSNPQTTQPPGMTPDRPSINVPGGVDPSPESEFARTPASAKAGSSGGLEGEGKGKGKLGAIKEDPGKNGLAVGGGGAGEGWDNGLEGFKWEGENVLGEWAMVDM